MSNHPHRDEDDEQVEPDCGVGEPSIGFESSDLSDDHTDDSPYDLVVSSRT
jgi:hypothetical protein